MITIPNAPAWLGVGWLIAVLVLFITIVLVILNQLPTTEALLIIGLALARIL